MLEILIVKPVHGRCLTRLNGSHLHGRELVAAWVIKRPVLYIAWTRVLRNWHTSIRAKNVVTSGVTLHFDFLRNLLLRNFLLFGQIENLFLN